MKNELLDAIMIYCAKRYVGKPNEQKRHFELLNAIQKEHSLQFIKENKSNIARYMAFLDATFEDGGFLKRPKLNHIQACAMQFVEMKIRNGFEPITDEEMFTYNLKWKNETK